MRIHGGRWRQQQQQQHPCWCVIYGKLGRWVNYKLIGLHVRMFSQLSRLHNPCTAAAHIKDVRSNWPPLGGSVLTASVCARPSFLHVRRPLFLICISMAIYAIAFNIQPRHATFTLRLCLHTAHRCGPIVRERIQPAANARSRLHEPSSHALTHDYIETNMARMAARWRYTELMYIDV